MGQKNSIPENHYVKINEIKKPINRGTMFLMHPGHRSKKKVSSTGGNYMPQPLTGEMPSKMSNKTEDLRIHSSQQELEVGIKNVKKAPEIPKVDKSLSAAIPRSGTIQE